jgi:alkyldihydroxyacetonephosphate synthase
MTSDPSIAAAQPTSPPVSSSPTAAASPSTPTSAASSTSPTMPTSPIELSGTSSRFGEPAPLSGGLLSELSNVCEVVTDLGPVAEASRDWWPLALHWSLAGQVPRRAAAIVRPTSTAEVADVVALANRHGVPVTPSGGRSGVCGASIPLHGGLLLDLTAMHGIVDIDHVSKIVEVLPGTFGPDYESALNTAGLTGGHWPQSMAISTVGGWLACRGAGQYSTRYGKIEDMVVGLEVVLADGQVIRTGGSPRASSGPDLTQLFVGSEGTLGVITRAWLRVHPAPAVERRAAYGFSSFAAGLDACRRILQRGATPAVLRLYDGPETARSHGGDGTMCALLVLDEGDPQIIDATMTVVGEECSAATRLDEALVERWFQHRNDTSALQGLTRKGFVVDTLEIAGPWAALPRIFDETCAALLAVPHARAATCHLSHSYSDGACLYFTMAATPPADEVESTYVALWDAGQRAVLAGGGNLSHHHGVGLNRQRFVDEALGSSANVLRAIKSALDPSGILNPGKLGLPSPFGDVSWP